MQNILAPLTTTNLFQEELNMMMGIFSLYKYYIHKF